MPAITQDGSGLRSNAGSTCCGGELGDAPDQWSALLTAGAMIASPQSDSDGISQRTVSWQGTERGGHVHNLIARGAAEQRASIRTTGRNDNAVEGTPSAADPHGAAFMRSGISYRSKKPN